MSGARDLEPQVMDLINRDAIKVPLHPPVAMKLQKVVATGKSNPEVASALFLSPRTGQTHVSRILRKLGYTSRMDLVRDGARR